MRLGLGLAAVAVVVAAASEARASHMNGIVPDDLFVIGANIADGAIVGAPDHPIFGFDATLAKSLVWGSLGARWVHDDRLLFVPYAEAGIWLGLNVGGGISVLANTTSRETVVPHFFLGAPIPLDYLVPCNACAWLIEPYYRPLWWGGNVLQETGVLVKLIWEPGASAPPRSPEPVVRRPLAEPPLVDPPLQTRP